MPSMEISEREQEVLDLLCLGLRNRQIADRLIITEGTVKCHVKNIFQKLGINRRTNLLIKQISVLNEKVQALNDELKEAKAERNIFVQKIALLEAKEQSNASD